MYWTLRGNCPSNYAPRQLKPDVRDFKGKEAGRRVSSPYSDLPRNGQEDFEMRNLLLTIAGVIWASLAGGNRRKRPLAIVQPVIKQGQSGKRRGTEDRGQEGSMSQPSGS